MKQYSTRLLLMTKDINVLIFQNSLEYNLDCLQFKKTDDNPTFKSLDNSVTNACGIIAPIVTVKFSDSFAINIHRKLA